MNLGLGDDDSLRFFEETAVGGEAAGPKRSKVDLYIPGSHGKRNHHLNSTMAPRPLLVLACLCLKHEDSVEDKQERAILGTEATE